jgi:hypothetical protein
MARERTERVERWGEVTRRDATHSTQLAPRPKLWGLHARRWHQRGNATPV